MNNKKVKDTGLDISRGSRLDNYWKKEGFAAFYKKLRSPKPSLTGTEDVHDLNEILISEYGFRGIEFGNWVNNESRFNYLVSAVVALEDIQRILKFKNSNLGLNKLGLAFGARGTGSAAGHFEPHNWIINLTRHSRDSYFELSGGVGALAHEFGHFLDYYYGTFVDKNWKYHSLTKGRLTATRFEQGEVNDKSLHGIANKIVHTCIWWDEGKNVYTDYYGGLKKKFGGTEYWFRHNEIFARAFEQYIFNQLKKKKISNSFLTAYKYDTKAYLDNALLAKVSPLFTKLMKMMSNKK